MLLVLGNPGAGCTSLLNILSNRRLGYAEVNGNVSFGCMSSDEAKNYRAQIIMVWKHLITHSIFQRLTQHIECGRRGLFPNTLGRADYRFCYPTDSTFSITTFDQLCRKVFPIIQGIPTELFGDGTHARYQSRRRVYTWCLWRRTKACLHPRVPCHPR